MLVTYTVEVDINDVWEQVVGGSVGYWADDFKTLDGGVVAWYTGTEYAPNPQSFKVLADGVWHIVTERNLAEAYVKLKQDGWAHCGHYGVDDNDACVGDAILQYAAFGELVYG